MRRRVIVGFLSVFMFLLLILDTKTAITGAVDGINKCIHTVIPSLFPFFVISKILLSYLDTDRLAFLKPLMYRCGIPSGAQSAFLLGILGGYPVGASLIADMHKSGKISRSSANRLLGFCNNAGPAFIFGMSAFLFHSAWIGWCIWLIQILSAIIVGLILPNKTHDECCAGSSETMSIIDSVEESIKAMAKISGWIVIFRIVIAYIDKITSNLPNGLWNIFMTGLLEMSNGCMRLDQIESDSLRFLFMNVFLSIGGLCVLLQTKNVAKNLSLFYYIHGSILKAQISVMQAVATIPLIFQHGYSVHTVTIMIASLALIAGHLKWLNMKKTVAYRVKVLYN